MKDALLTDIQAIIQKVTQQLPGFDRDLFLAAYRFARQAHDGQVRKDGSPYIVHPVETAKTLSQLKVDQDTLIAALLHDVPEDTPHTIEEISELFGPKVAFLVEGITKLAKVHYQNDMETRQIESLRKLLIHTARDPRVILIKLADRLHNMRTLHFVTKPEKQRRIARETLEMYVPMASLLGIQGIKSELQDLCFTYLYPEEFQLYRDRIASSDQRLQPLQEEVTEGMRRAFTEHHVRADIFSRRKTLYSIFHKMQSQGKSIDDVYDLITLRIVVDGIDDAYLALGVIHTMYKPKPGKFKDYIAVPKVNGYRSLHTTVFGPNGVLVEFQIRTREMDLEADYGITTFYFLGSKQATDDQVNEERRMQWMSQILDLEQQEINSRNFLEKVKGDIFEDKIFVFTPKGEAIHLPRDATSIDFAYTVHTDVGNHAVGVEINGTVASLTAPLHNGDTVKIITNPHSKGPLREWLDFIKTNVARARVREFFNKESVHQKVESGRSLLQKAFDRAGIGLIDDIPFKRMQTALEHAHYPHFPHLPSLLSAIGEGSLDPINVIEGLFPTQRLTTMSRSSSLLGGLFSRIVKPQLKERISLKIVVNDRSGIARDIMNVLGQMRINILKLSGSSYNILAHHGCVVIVFELDSFDQLQSVISRLEQINGVVRVKRVFFSRDIIFILLSFVTACFWLSHPFIVQYLIANKSDIYGDITVYGGLLLLLAFVFYFKHVTQRRYSQMYESKLLLVATTLITLLALGTLVLEIIYYDLAANRLLIATIVSVTVVYLGLQYWRFFRNRRVEVD